MNKSPLIGRRNKGNTISNAVHGNVIRKILRRVDANGAVNLTRNSAAIINKPMVLTNIVRAVLERRNLLRIELIN